MEANIIYKFIIRKYILISLLIITPLGFLCKIYTGPAQFWVQNYAVGILYVIFWCFIIFLFIPNIKFLTQIVLLVFFVTGILEILQLWHPPFLEFIRSFFIGRTLLGTSFSWWDFPHYAIGCIAAWLWVNFLNK